MLKPALFSFFEEGFRRVSDFSDSEQIRLCDLAKLYLRVLVPFAGWSEFLVSILDAENVWNQDKKKGRKTLNEDMFIQLTFKQVAGEDV